MNGLNQFSRLLLLVVVALTLGAYLLHGIDFSLGVLLGSGIVVINYFWSVRVFSRILGGAQLKFRLGITWVVKLGLTASVLYVAVVLLKMQPVGIIVGVSAVAIAGLMFAGISRIRQLHQ